MILKKVLVGLALAGLFVTSGAFAASLYVQGEGGYVRQSVENWTVFQVKSQPNTYGVGGAVGLLFPAGTNLKLGAQVGYDYLGKSKYSFSSNDPKNPLGAAYANASDRIQTVDLLGIAKVPVGQFNLIGGAGAAYELSTIKVAGDVPIANFNGSEKFEKHSIRPEVMAGVSYNLTKKLAAGVEYKHIFGDTIGSAKWVEDQGKSTTVNAVLATLSYKF